MKTKKKMIAMVEIAIVLCSVFLLALPAIAAEQTMQKAIITASEDDYVLGIYGNANEDDTIDMGDVVYTKLAIFGKKPKTELCDAKYDGRINVLDVIQTKLIILGKDKELTFIDYMDRIVTVKKPLKRIVLTGSPKNLETLRSLGVEKDRVVGVDALIQISWKAFFPEYQDKPTVSGEDLESIIDLHPDAVSICPGPGFFGGIDKKCDVLESAGITVFVFRYSRPETYLEEITKLGYIYGMEEAREFLDFYQGIITNTIKERVEKIPEEDKPKVYIETNSAPYKSHSKIEYIEMAGGKSILPDAYGSVDPEAVIKGDPDIIVKKATCTVCGYDKDADDTAGIENIRDEIMSRPELQNVAAVKTGKVYAIANQLSCYGHGCGCRYFLQIAYQAKWFHPEIFEDIDPKPIHQEYLTRFQGLDIDLDKKGVFVYPEPS